VIHRNAAVFSTLAPFLFSLQLGVSYERTFASEEIGLVIADGGGSGVFIHPGSFRLGTGIIWILKHSGT